MDRKYILNFVLFSLGYILLGILFIAAPEQSKTIIFTIMGIVAIISGLTRIVWHFIKDDFSRAFVNDIPVGVVLVLAGIYLIFRGEVIWNVLPVLLGFAVVFDSIIKLQHAFDLRRTGFLPWWGVLVAALATGVLGILLILPVFGPDVLLYYFGTVLIVDGVINLCTITLLSWRTRKVQKEGLPPKEEKAPPEEPK